MENYLLLSFTPHDLTTIIREAVKESLAGNKQSETKQYFYSIKELAAFLNCSIVTAQKLENSGKIRFKQYGQKCIFSSVEVPEDAGCRSKGVQSGQSHVKAVHAHFTNSEVFCEKERFITMNSGT